VRLEQAFCVYLGHRSRRIMSNSGRVIERDCRSICSYIYYSTPNVRYINENRDGDVLFSSYTVSSIREIGCRSNRPARRALPPTCSFPSSAIVPPSPSVAVFSLRARPIINTCINWFTADRFRDGGDRPRDTALAVRPLTPEDAV